MRINNTSIFAVCVMVRLAQAAERGETPVSGKELGRRVGLSEAYTEVIFRPLIKAKWVQTIIGSKGGYRLTVSPQDLCLSEVWEATNSSFDIVDCCKGKKPSDKCPACKKWNELAEIIKNWAAKLTLADFYAPGAAKPE